MNKKAMQKVKLGDRLRYQFECDVEVVEGPEITDDDTCSLLVRVLRGPFVDDDVHPELRIEEPPRVLIEHLGNIFDIDAQIEQLQRQRAELEGLESTEPEDPLSLSAKPIAGSSSSRPAMSLDESNQQPRTPT